MTSFVNGYFFVQQIITIIKLKQLTLCVSWRYDQSNYGVIKKCEPASWESAS